MIRWEKIRLGPVCRHSTSLLPAMFQYHADVCIRQNWEDDNAVPQRYWLCQRQSVYNVLLKLPITSPHWEECEVLCWACLYVVCLSVCLSVRSYISKTGWLNFTEFSLPVVCGRGLVPARRCDTLCTSGFVDDNMFLPNWPYSVRHIHRVS